MVNAEDKSSRRTKRRARNRNLSIKYGIVFTVNALGTERTKLREVFLSNNIGEKNVAWGRSFINNINWMFIVIDNASLSTEIKSRDMKSYGRP